MTQPPQSSLAVSFASDGRGRFRVSACSEKATAQCQILQPAIPPTKACFVRIGSRARPFSAVTRGLVPRVSLREARCQPKRDRRDKPGDDTKCVARFERNTL